jgi:integrase
VPIVVVNFAIQHKRALARVNVSAKKRGVKELNFFQPYVLRHTALTRLAEAGCDVFTLARIAGHSSITITQRYVHPQADAIERAFQQTTKAALPAGATERSGTAKNLGGHKNGYK